MRRSGLLVVQNPRLQQNTSGQVVTDSRRPHYVVQASGLSVCGYDRVPYRVGSAFLFQYHSLSSESVHFLPRTLRQSGPHEDESEPFGTDPEFPRYLRLRGPRLVIGINGIEVPTLGDARIEDVFACRLPRPVQVKDVIYAGECGVPAGKGAVLTKEGPATLVAPECLQSELDLPASPVFWRSRETAC